MNRSTILIIVMSIVPAGTDAGAKPPPPVDARSSASPAADPTAAAQAKHGTYKTAGMVRANHARMKEQRDAPVHVIETDDPLEAGRRICEAVVPRRAPATPVLLKPNLSGIDRLRSGMDNGVELRTTGIEFLRGVIRCLRARGHKRITITEAWSRPKSFKRWQRLTGLDRLLKDERVRFVGMWDDRGRRGDKSGMLHARLPGAKHVRKELLIPRLLAYHLDHGLFISIPRMKMHRFTVMSMGIKNNMGFVNLDGATPTKSRRSRLHAEIGPWLRAFKRRGKADPAGYRRAVELFSERIVDVLELELPDAVLIDAVPGVGGDGFARVVPMRHGAAIGSVNPVLADAVGMEYAGYLNNAALQQQLGHATSPLLTEAARRFYGGTDLLQNIAVTGDTGFRKRREVAYFRAFPGWEIGVKPQPPVELPWHARAVSAVRASEAPTIDGQLNDPAWKTARPTSIETDWRGKKAGPRTEVKLVWTPEALFFAFDCAFETLNVDEEAPIDVEHRKLYRYDAVELFIDAQPRNHRTYRELEIGPLGHFMDIDVDRRRRKRGDVSWSSGMRVKTHIDRRAKRFVIEGAVPAKAFDADRLKAGNWRLGLYRIAGKKPGRIYMARFPTRTAKPNFHVPKKFGWLRLLE